MWLNDSEIRELDQDELARAALPGRGPWRTVLERLSTDRAHYEQLSAASRQAALAYAAGLTGESFEAYLEKIVQTPKRRETAGGESLKPVLSPERQRLMALRLRRKHAGGAADVAE